MVKLWPNDIQSHSKATPKKWDSRLFAPVAPLLS